MSAGIRSHCTNLGVTNSLTEETGNYLYKIIGSFNRHIFVFNAKKTRFSQIVRNSIRC